MVPDTVPPPRIRRLGATIEDVYSGSYLIGGSMSARRLAVCLTLALASSTAVFAQAPTPPAQPPAKPDEPPIYEEQVVVTASKLEQQLVNAPATMTVVTQDVIASTPATNYAELETRPG